MPHDGRSGVAGRLLGVVLGAVVYHDDQVDVRDGAGGADRRGDPVLLVLSRYDYCYALLGGCHTSSLAFNVEI